MINVDNIPKNSKTQRIKNKTMTLNFIKKEETKSETEKNNF